MARPRRTSRMTVEECRCLDVDAMRRAGIFASPTGSTWRVAWKSADGESDTTICYAISANSGCVVLCMNVELNDGASKGRMPDGYSIEITTTEPRYWFRCPLVRNGVACRRRVGRLYQPPGQRIFGCRACYQLTYDSCQRHDKRKSALIRDPLALARALQSRNPRQQILGIGAYAQAVARLAKARRR